MEYLFVLLSISHWLIPLFFFYFTSRGLYMEPLHPSYSPKSLAGENNPPSGAPAFAIA